MDNESTQGANGGEGANEKIETPRFKKIFEIVTAKYPTPDFVKRATDLYNKPFDQLDEEDQGYLQNYLPNRYRHDLNQLAKDIEQTKVEDDKISDYLDAIDILSRNTILVKQINDPLSGPANILQNAIIEIRSSETLERAKLWNELYDVWTTRYPRQEDTIENDIRRDFGGMVTLLSGRNRYPKPEPKPIDQTRNLANVYMDAFAVINSIERQNDYRQPRVRNALNAGVESFIERADNPENIYNLLDLYQTIKSEDPALVEKLLDIASRYGRYHGLDQMTEIGLVAKLLPLLKSNDPQVEILSRGGNIWGMDGKSLGVAEFLVHTLTTQATPLVINEDVMILREVPATTLARLEQNRKDALSLAGNFGILRDFIHDQQPYVHEVLKAMVDYYYTGNRKNLEGILNKTKYFNFSQSNKDKILNRSNYDMSVRTNGEYEEPSIQVLKRLVESTIPIEELPPQTSNNELNKLMLQLEKGKLGGIAKEQDLQTVLDKMNTELITLINLGEVGIEPNMIKAIAWLDQQSFRVLESLSLEDQQRLFKSSLLKSLLLFEELTNSLKDFDQQIFSQFMEQVNQSDSSEQAYKLIQSKILNNIHQLALHYKQQGREHIIGSLWSGNAAHALIGLTDYKEAETIYGQKYKKEAESRRMDPTYHPGD